MKAGYPETKEELDAMFRLRAEAYRKEGYVTAESDKDKYDLENKCVYFIAKLNEKMVGTVRLVIDDPLPTELAFDFEEPEEIARIPRNKRGEISRLIVVEKGMNHLISLNLFKAMFEFGKEYDYLGGYASVKDSLVQILSAIRAPLYRISPATLKYDGSLLHGYFYEGDEEVVPVYYLRDKAAEFMEKMML